MIICKFIIIDQTSNQITKQKVNNQSRNTKYIQKQSTRMTEINNELISEIIFTNEKAFNNLDINKAKILSCICKTASLNKNIKLSFDRFKVREYFDKIFDVITHYIMYKKKEEYMIHDEFNKIYGEEYSITSQLDDIIEDLKKENLNVLDGFRELIVLEFKEFIYNYENGDRDSYNIQYNLDYCIQYNLVVNYFGYYEYYKNHTYNSEHFVITPDSLYDFVK